MIADAWRQEQEFFTIKRETKIWIGLVLIAQGEKGSLLIDVYIFCSVTTIRTCLDCF